MGRRKKKKLALKIKTETMYTITGVVFFLLAILIMVSFTGKGLLLQTLNAALIRELGAAMLLLPAILMQAGTVMFQLKWKWAQPRVLLGGFMFSFGFAGLLRTGSIGQNLFSNLSQLVSPVGAMVVFLGLLLIGTLVMAEMSFKELAEWWEKYQAEQEKKREEAAKLAAEAEPATAKGGFSLPKLGFGGGKKQEGFSINENEIPDSDVEHGIAVETPQAAAAAAAEALAKTQAQGATTTQTGSGDDLSEGTIQSAATANLIWEYPPLSLLSDSKGGKADRGDVKANADTIERTLESFGIKAEVREVNYGPSVTQYALRITQGTKLSKVTSLSTDLALALAAPTGQIRIEAPIAGRSLVGIEVPNRSAQYVTLRTMLSSSKMRKHKSKLAVALGINVAGEPVVADIASMPHVLIAGATGSGKSVAMNAFMCSMLYRSSPAEVKFILVDPKRVELTGYNGIPHLLTPVIVEPPKVVAALKWATVEMDRRYKQLAEVGVKNIDGYNEVAGFVAMPKIVILIDELADIMLFAPKEVEESITRIAQMARAVGIHLVLATQRPSVDVITGLIKANVPTRIAFNVTSVTDSRVILDNPGAEKLLGRGDMLYVPPDQAKPSRIQGTFVSDKEAKELIDYIKSQGQEPEYEEDITTKYKPGTSATGSGGVSSVGDNDRDELFDEAVTLFAKSDRASASLIQRRLSVGYARAARILDQLFEAGFIGPHEGSKPREVKHQVITEYLTKQAAGGGEG